MKLQRTIAGITAALCALTLGLTAGCSSEESSSSSPGALSSAMSRGLTLLVDQVTGDMEISRPQSGKTMGAITDDLSSATTSSENPWTIFVYLCASDLESGQAAATDDILEMTNGADNENVRFVVEAGGTSEWQNDSLDAEQTERLVIQNGEIVESESLELRNMGESDTLADFLTWGLAAYPSDRNGLILWDHGGGSVTGMCIDENFDGDTLSLKEIDAALLSAYGTMDDKFDFIGFDACLMSTLETANVAASYADYMYASQESELGTGWDYAGFSNYLAENPQATGAELGKTVVDTYCDLNLFDVDSEIVTLSVIDLAKIDNVITSFNTFSRDLCNTANNTSELASIVRGVNEADNYGGNNRSEGYTNMVDLRGLAEACEPYVSSSADVMSSLADAVVYSKSGEAHEDAGGLSVYYPLSVNDADELAVFEQVCVSPYYLSFVDTIERTSAQDASDVVFDPDPWFKDNSWEWTSDYDYDDDTGLFGYDSDTLNEEYWSYENESEETGESPLIKFSEGPDYDENGNYYFVLSPESIDYAAGVSAYVYEVWSEDEIIELGETCDIYGDWSTGAFYDNFDGTWLSLPDGQNLAIYVAERTDNYVVYTSPVILNGEETNLRIRQYYDDNRTVVEGTWDGIEENGVSSRNVRAVQDGDSITPQYYSYYNESDDTDYDGYEYIVEGEFVVEPSLLQGYDYEYSFVIDDVYGDYYMTDPAYFEVDDNGTVSYE